MNGGPGPTRGQLLQSLVCVQREWELFVGDCDHAGDPVPGALCKEVKRVLASVERWVCNEPSLPGEYGLEEHPDGQL